MRLREILVALGALGCASTPLESAPAPASGPTHRVEGELRAIRLQNINKAQGHYTYNVELLVAVDAVDPPTALGPELAVRLPKRPTWSGMSPAERDALSSDGPQPTFSPSSWEGYHVGQRVDLQVSLTSAELGLLR